MNQIQRKLNSIRNRVYDSIKNKNYNYLGFKYMNNQNTIRFRLGINKDFLKGFNILIDSKQANEIKNAYYPIALDMLKDIIEKQYIKIAVGDINVS